MLELGNEAEAYHREIGRMLSPEKIQYVFTYGKLSMMIAEEAKKNYPKNQVQSFQNKDGVAAKILEIINEKDIVLLKGSRGMALEEIVQRWM